ncbi:MAG: DUF86 domain-containing protein [Magnetococcales bacterium]|nr:DUF86 domain-containing protein [Magnetococcales bacterium]
MSRDDHVPLRHMLDAATDALSFVEGRVLADLHTDRMLLHALIRCLEVIGEAAGDLSDACRDQATHVPWRAMIAMRNRLIHGYFDVDHEIVWLTVTRRLPDLVTRVRDLLSEIASPSVPPGTIPAKTPEA